jgi:hypothetical protein
MTLLKTTSSFCTIISLLLLSACNETESQVGPSFESDEVTYSNLEPNNIALLISSTDDLPTCNSENTGYLYYVIQTSSFQACFEESYEEVSFQTNKGPDGNDGNDGTIGEHGNSCELQEVVDVGYLLRCQNGNSVVIKNGANGVNADDGASLPSGQNGTSCDFTEIDNSTNTIVCEDGTSATITDGLPGETGDMGDQGNDATGIEWLGSLKEAPLTPILNQSFYWEDVGVTCIWDGDSWEKISSDLNVTAECPQ